MTTEKAIWIIGDLRSPRLWSESLKVTAKARALCQEAGARMTMVLMGFSGPRSSKQRAVDSGPCVDMADAARGAVDHGVHTVFTVDHEALAIPRTHVIAGVLEDLVNRHRPWLVLFGLNDFGREVSAFCVQRCNAGMIADCTELVLKEDRVAGRCPAWGGQIAAEITLADGWETAFATVQPHGIAARPVSDPDGRIERIVPEEVPIPDGMELVERAMEPPDARRLEDARIVVVGGAGLGHMKSFGLVRELAASPGRRGGRHPATGSLSLGG